MHWCTYTMLPSDPGASLQIFVSLRNQLVAGSPLRPVRSSQSVQGGGASSANLPERTSPLATKPKSGPKVALSPQQQQLVQLQQLQQYYQQRKQLKQRQQWSPDPPLQSQQQPQQWPTPTSQQQRALQHGDRDTMLSPSAATTDAVSRLSWTSPSPSNTSGQGGALAGAGKVHHAFAHAMAVAQRDPTGVDIADSITTMPNSPLQQADGARLPLSLIHI